jgi:hypothetical protein
LSFDLTGLAPTPEELESFVNDSSKKAYEKQVDRLLASPHFGEKWARHWMDLVRYAETKAFEQDYTMPYAHRYRDYLIRAFNEDVPYDQFIKESLAGDLLKNPRPHPDTGENESVMGPGYFYLTDGQHGPPDIHEDEARIFDSMIDVSSKAFLGFTLACARCHDHKFDAITTADYYSFYGMLRSSRLSYANTISEKLQTKVQSRLKKEKKNIRSLVFDACLEDIEKAPDYLKARRELLDNQKLKDALGKLEAATSKNKKKTGKPYDKLLDLLAPFCEARAAESDLDPAVLSSWLLLALSSEFQEMWPELQALHIAIESKTEPEETSPEWKRSEAFAQITGSLDPWKRQGLAFLEQREKPGELILAAEGNLAVQSMIGNSLVGGRYSSRISGAIRSPDFILDGNPVILEAKGRFATIRLIVRNYELTGRGPTTAALYAPINGDHWETVRFETDLWVGQPAHLEITQNGQATHSLHPTKDIGYPAFDENAYISFRFDEDTNWTRFWQTSLTQYESENTDLLIVSTLQLLWEKGKRNKLDTTEAEVLGALFGAGLLKPDMERSEKLQSAMAKYRAKAREIPTPHFVRSLVDGDSIDEPVYIRGSHKNLSKEENPRHFLDGLGGAPLKSSGSGRLEWAQQVARSDNPLTSRVLVNRLWKQLFGNGIVTTVNSFGKMGFPPTHPELLDYLATDFTRHGWSSKYIIRKMALSSTYRMSSNPSLASQKEDPENKLLQHMPIKRLEAEAIRDHILACSGELDPSLYGPSVSAYVEDLPDSRAKPPTGPINGNARRSIYLEMRRNFLPTFLRAFDLPNATESTGVRPATNVPAQSLALMNDGFVHQQAKAWAEEILRLESSTEDRINRIHVVAFSRPATDKEQSWAKDFIKSIANDYKTDEEDPKVWTDLCHLMYNRKDFIYLF